MKIIKKISNVFYWVVIVSLLAISLSTILSAFNTPLGIRLFTVMSGSMEPTLHVGSIVIVKSQASYQTADIVTVRSERNAKETVTHRIAEILADSDTNSIKYSLKGDANENPDPEPILSRRVIGKAIFSIPLLGYPIAFAKTQTGLITLIIIPATLIIYTELMNIKKEVTHIIRKHKKINKIT